MNQAAGWQDARDTASLACPHCGRRLSLVPVQDVPGDSNGPPRACVEEGSASFSTQHYSPQSILGVENPTNTFVSACKLWNDLQQSDFGTMGRSYKARWAQLFREHGGARLLRAVRMFAETARGQIKHPVLAFIEQSEQFLANVMAAEGPAGDSPPRAPGAPRRAESRVPILKAEL